MRSVSDSLNRPYALVLASMEAMVTPTKETHAPRTPTKPPGFLLLPRGHRPLGDPRSRFNRNENSGSSSSTEGDQDEHPSLDHQPAGPPSSESAHDGSSGSNPGNSGDTNGYSNPGYHQSRNSGSNAFDEGGPNEVTGPYHHSDQFAPDSHDSRGPNGIPWSGSRHSGSASSVTGNEGHPDSECHSCSIQDYIKIVVVALVTKAGMMAILKEVDQSLGWAGMGLQYTSYSEVMSLAPEKVVAGLSTLPP